MSLPREDQERVSAVVERFRRNAGLETYPVDLDAAYAYLGLPTPQPLSGDALMDELPYAPAPGIDTSHWQYKQLGYINSVTLEVFVDTTLPRQRLRMVMAHELMHYQLGHCAIAGTTWGQTSAVRHEMELEAAYAAVRLVLPPEQFVERLAKETRRAGRQPGFAEVGRVVDHFDVTLYTGLRRLIDTSPHAVALVSVLPPARYQGDAEPRNFRLRAFCSPTWKDRRGCAVPDEILDLRQEPLARAAADAMEDLRNPAKTEEVAAQAGLRFDAVAEVCATPHSVHILLRPDDD